MLINFQTFMERIGEPDERPKDRRFAYWFASNKLKREWKIAEAKKDYARLDELDRGFRQLECL